MATEQRKVSRVHQLRDLFQSGKPRPSEELDYSSNRRQTPNYSFNKNGTIHTQNVAQTKQNIVQEQSISELDSASLRSMSDLSDQDLIYTANDIHYKATNDSDSDIDSPRSNHRNKEIDNKPSGIDQSIDKKPNGPDTLTLCPLVPFGDGLQTKIRPLGEEFRIRRIMKISQPSPQSSSKNSPELQNTDNQSKSLPLTKNPSKLLNLPRSSTNNNPVFGQLNTTSNQIKGNLDQQSLIGNGRKLRDTDFEFKDGVRYNKLWSPKKHLIQSDDMMDIVADSSSYKQTTMDNGGLHQSISIDSITMNQSYEGEAIAHFQPEFQDFLLEPGNFQVDSPMKAESVDLEERTSSEDEINGCDDDGDDDGDEYYDDAYNGGNELECDLTPTIFDPNYDDISPINNHISFEMICPQPMEVVSVKGGCHILEDGHFFYEKVVEIDSDSESDLESQNILTNNNIVKTHKRPGATVHFNLNKVRVYSTYISDEYNRRNEDIDPLSSSAEYEMEKRLEKMDIFPVELFKGNTGLGISILGMGVGHSTGKQKLGIFVKSITTGGAAEMDGRIRIYDQLVEVDGQSLVSVTQEFAASVLRNTQGVVKFLIGREADQSTSEIVRLVEKSRQNSGLAHEPLPVSPAAMINTNKDKINGIVNQNEIVGDLSAAQQTLSHDNANEENVPITTDNSINVPTTISDNNDEEIEQSIINNLSQQIRQYRLNESILTKTISDLKDHIDRDRIWKSELELLYGTVESDSLKKDLKIKDLTLENSLLKEKLEETSKKYKKIKELLKIESPRNNDMHNGDQEKDLVSFYKGKVKSLEDLVKCMELDSGDPICTSEMKNFLSDESINCHINTEMKNKFHQEKDSDKVHINLKINLTNNNNDSVNLKFPEVKANKLLDNDAAKNKAELRKLGQMSNRKPPTKSMMIGNPSNDVLDSNVSEPKSLLYNGTNDAASRNNQNESTAIGNSSYKINASKMIGGFALPGKSEIKLGMRPSDIVVSKRLDKIENPPIESQGPTKGSLSSRKSNPMQSSTSVEDGDLLNNRSTKLVSATILPLDSPNVNPSNMLNPLKDNNDLQSTLTSNQSNAMPVTIISSNGSYKTKL